MAVGNGPMRARHRHRHRHRDRHSTGTGTDMGAGTALLCFLLVIGVVCAWEELYMDCPEMFDSTRQIENWLSCRAGEGRNHKTRVPLQWPWEMVP